MNFLGKSSQKGAKSAIYFRGLKESGAFGAFLGTFS